MTLAGYVRERHPKYRHLTDEEIQEAVEYYYEHKLDGHLDYSRDGQTNRPSRK